MKTSRGMINTTAGLVAMSDNGVQVIVVDGQNGWIFNTESAVFTMITDPDFPAGAKAVTFSDGFFLVNTGGMEVGITSGRFHKSAAYDGLAWAPLDFATAEFSSDPLINIFVHQGYLALFGTLTTEAWQNTGGTAFPYNRVAGGVIEWGLAAKNSVAKYDNSIIYLAANRLRGRQVVIVQDFIPRVISGQDFEAELSKYVNINDAVAFSYWQSGHSFYHISFPSAGKSWIYDLTTENWSEVFSSGGRHRALLGINFLDRIIVSDYEKGKIYELSDKFLDDNGMEMVCELTSKHLFGENRMTINRLWLDVQPATGTVQAPNPVVELRVSKDGGNTYGVGVPAAIGNTGEYSTRCKWSRLGRARDWVFKFRMTSPVKFVITGAWINTVEE
ncbi:MAG: hypothetical protein ACRD98_00445 [Nitrososphaera sp.]